MITNINEKNSNQYQALFEKATLDLAKYTRDGELVETNSQEPCFKATKVEINDENAFFESEDVLFEKTLTGFAVADSFKEDVEYYTFDETITSLSDYFSNIETLALINPQLYTRLPIDENFFEINANTRTINVPAEFKSAGVGVAGDHRAEYLWFKIKRYYDATDLSTKFCRIEWNVGKQKGISELWGSDGSTVEQAGYDLESFPGYIVFGWCITDFVTLEEANSVSFAVRFYETQDSKTYSLSTLPATLSIKKTLNYDLIFDETEYKYDNDGMFRDRFENKISGNDIIRALKPEFLSVKYNGKNYVVGEDAPYTMNLNKDKDPTSEWFNTCAAMIKYPVSAYSTDGGKISYSWKCTDPDNTRTIKPVTYKTEYIETEDTTNVSNKRYFILVDGVYTDLSTTIKEQTDNNIKVYEKVSYAEIQDPGRYSVIVKNRAGKDTNSIEVPLVLVNKAKKPIFENTPVVSGVLKLNTPVRLTAKAIPQEESGAVITYKWQKKELAGNAPYETVAEGAENFYEATAPGYYKVSAINRINRSEDVENCPVESRITLMPVAPEVETDKTEIHVSENEIVTVSASIPTEANEVHLADEVLTYQWYKIVASNNVALEDETTNQYVAKDTERGYRIYCEVTNNYNGEKAVAMTDPVLVNA